MISDWELWACANHVLQHHADDPRMFVVERIASLVETGDAEGIATWQAIGRRVHALMGSTGVRQ